MYWGDYARDTGHLNALGHGAYLMLIKHYWSIGGALPDDDDELWRVACCDSKKEWLRLRPKIVRLFIQDGGKLRHKRVEMELLKACAITNAKAEAGKRGAEVRWQNHGTRIADASNSHRQTDTPSQSPLPKEEYSPHNPPLDAAPQAAPTALNGAKHDLPKRTRYVPGEAPAFDEFWRRYPRKIEGPVTAKKAWDKAIASGAEPNAIIGGVARYRFDTREDGRYLPHATTWLNQERWTTQADTLPLAPVGPRKTTPTYGGVY